VDGKLRCGHCGEWKFPDDFYAANTLRGRQADCRECQRELRWRARYNLSGASYRRIWAEQGGACAICREPEAAHRKLDVDHDHGCCPGSLSCGRCVRGLLCKSCNVQVLPVVEDSPALVLAAETYLAAAPMLRARQDIPQPKCLPDIKLRSRYGISLRQYEEAFAAQGGTCAVCREPDARRTRLSVDHDHQCCPGERSCGQCLRGLVCRRCNFHVLPAIESGAIEAAQVYLARFAPGLVAA
jgi:Recombination endonuclease VII